MLAIVVQSLIALTIASVMPAYAVPVAIFTLVFQNIFVSIMSPLISGPSELEFIKGYNFLICAVMWAAAVTTWLVKWRSAPTAVTRLMVAGIAVMAVIGVYFLVGFMQDPLASVIYLRNVVFPLLMFQLALLTASSHATPLTRVLIAIGVLMVVCGYLEFSFRDCLARHHQWPRLLALRGDQGDR